jgi:hypothetical protein
MGSPGTEEENIACALAPVEAFMAPLPELASASAGAFFVYTGAAMGDPVHSALHVEKSDCEILVTLPGTTYTAVLQATRRWAARLAAVFDEDDPRVQMNVSEFLLRAWKLAHNKARELSWIV